MAATVSATTPPVDGNDNVNDNDDDKNTLYASDAIAGTIPVETKDGVTIYVSREEVQYMDAVYKNCDIDNDQTDPIPVDVSASVFLYVKQFTVNVLKHKSSPKSVVEEKEKQQEETKPRDDAPSYWSLMDAWIPRFFAQFSRRRMWGELLLASDFLGHEELRHAVSSRIYHEHTGKSAEETRQIFFTGDDPIAPADNVDDDGTTDRDMRET